MIKSYSKDNNSIHIISLSCGLVPPVSYGGIELVIANLCKGLSNLGAKVICYSPGELNIDGIKHIKTLAKPSPSIKEGGEANTIEHLEVIKTSLKRYAKRGDVLLFNHPSQFRYLKKKLRLEFTFKLNLFEIAHTIDSGVYKNVIYPSNSLQKSVNKPGSVIPHGIELKYSNGEASREDHLFYAGSIDRDKGVHIAVELAKKANRKLIIAGPRKGNSFENSIIKNDVVEYIGELSYEGLFKQYSKAKALVYLTQINEPFGLVPLEAQAAGCPVITTGHGGTGETVIDGESGFFCNTLDDAEVALANIDNISSCNCIKSAKRFSQHKMATSYLKLFSNKHY